MSFLKLPQQVIEMALVMFLLIGCAALEVVPAPPTGTPFPSTVTSAATPVPSIVITPSANLPVLITRAEMLIGNWQPLSTGHAAMFLQFNSDGTCRQSASLEGLTNIPQVECTFMLEGANLSMTVVKLTGVPECPTPTGTYDVRLVAEDRIKLVPIKDACTPRKNSTQGEYQRIP